MRPLAIATSSSSRTSSLPTPGFPPSRCPTPSPPCPFAALPVPWPPPLPAFVAAFVLTPTLWGPAALLPSCSIPSSSSSLPCAGASLPRAARARRRRPPRPSGLLAPADSSPRCLAPPNPPVPTLAWRPGASLARGALLCVSARSGVLRGQWTMRNYGAMARGQRKCDFPII